MPRETTAEPLDAPATHAWLSEARACTLTHAELLTRYCTWVYAKLGSYQQTAAALGLDRRTVKAKIDRKLLKQFLLDAEKSTALP